jgi:GT2 family glycosyltransferase/glycosyltransferase involved in cell wall biosynthesis
VENGSGDDSAKLLAEVEDIVLVVSKDNLGFAGGSNLGVRKSSGEYVAFLNNDARPDAQWVRAAIAAFGESPQVGAVASKVLDWEGVNVDYIGAGMTWFGKGYKPFTSEPMVQQYDAGPADVLFGTGSAMFVRRTVFETLGGFDESFFMFFEDVDFGWRLNLRGFRYRYEPASIAFHKHHASMVGFGEFKEAYLLERNALFTLYKNVSDDGLREALPAAISLSIRRGVSDGRLDSTELDLRKPGGDSELERPVPKVTLSSVYAVDQFVEHLPLLRRSRDQVQSTRVVSDAQVWRLFGLADAPAGADEYYVAGYENIADNFDVTAPQPTRKVLVITGDPIGRKVAGPAIRAWNMALTLSRGNSVRLLSLAGVSEVTAPFDLVEVRPGDEKGFAVHEQWADVIVFQGLAMALFEGLRDSKKIIVADIYDPMHLEQLEQARQLPVAEWKAAVGDATDVLNEQLMRADFFMCASERQRLFYLGQLAALGRVNPDTSEGSPDLARLLAVVPFGLSSSAPQHANDVLKNVVDGISSDDKVLLWSGGLYNWFDPHTLIRAVAKVAITRPTVRLFFQGTKHPNPGVPEMSIVATSRDLASELGVLDKSIFFNDSWVENDQRQNYLLEADAGVSTHFNHIETTFSFRTRILDYLWAELPMVVTEGDVFAELVEREKLGEVVPAGDVDALANALDRVLFDEPFIAVARDNIRRVRERFYWEAVLQPLVEFVSNPSPAGDRRYGQGAAPRQPRKRKKRSGIRHDVSRVLYYLRNGGTSVVMAKFRNRLRRNR